MHMYDCLISYNSFKIKNGEKTLETGKICKKHKTSG